MEEKIISGAKQVSGETIRKNMLWNVIGSVGFIGAQWMMTILIVHLAGYTEAGYLSLGLSLTNIFTNIAYFCIRNYQVSDTAGKYSQDIYVTHRILATAVAFILYGLFVLCNGYSFYVTAFLLLFMVYRLNEPLVDVFHGIDQRAWRLDVAGQSFLMRGILTLGIFILLEKLTGSLTITTFVMIVAVYSIILGFDIPRAHRCTPFRLRLERNSLFSLTKECFPLFIYAVCLNAVVPIPRYFLERIAGSEVLGYYGSVAIPASVIQLLSSYIYTTFTTLFSEYGTLLEAGGGYFGTCAAGCGRMHPVGGMGACPRVHRKHQRLCLSVTAYDIMLWGDRSDLVYGGCSDDTQRQERAVAGRDCRSRSRSRYFLAVYFEMGSGRCQYLPVFIQCGDTAPVWHPICVVYEKMATVIFAITSPSVVCRCFRFYEVRIQNPVCCFHSYCSE